MADEPYDAKPHLRYLEDRVSVAQRALKKDPKNLALIKALQEASVAALAITCVGKTRPHLRTHEERHSFRKAARLSFYAPIDQCCANCHKVPDATAKLRRCGRCREAMHAREAIYDDRSVMAEQLATMTAERRRSEELAARAEVALAQAMDDKASAAARADGAEERSREASRREKLAQVP